ncbi:MAG: right-handed parallel beta-helix repeat-containing protein, partial [Candidatus Zixiibacteriota bacterium]
PQKNIDPAGDLGDRPGGEAVIDGRIKINSYGSGIVVNGFKIIGDHAPMQKSAVFIQHGPGAEISHNIIVDSRKDGVQLGFAFNDTPGALLKNNYIYNSTECGILNFSNDDELNLGNADFEVSDNYIIESGYHGIHLNFKGLDNIIKNNVIDSNSLNDTAYYAIFNTTRTNIDSNIIANSSNGILTSYRGTGIGDRAEIKNNLISNISYPAITVGDWNLADNFGTYTYIYNNSITNCNHTGRNGNDNWQYGSITVLDNSNYTSLIANNISDGVKGITILADSVTIKNNIIDNMGQSYAGENSYNGNVYFNCGVQVGDSRPDEEKAIIFDPSGTVIYDNKIQNNYINIYQNPSLSRGINASANWWGSYNDDVFLGVFLCNSIDYTPWLSLASDTDPNAPGFQGSFAALWVDDNSPQYNDSGRIQEAMSLVKNNGSVYLMDGIYQNPFSADARTNVNLIGETREGTIFKPSQTIPWDVSTYGSSRQTAIRVVNSVNFNIKRMTIDFSLIGGDSRYGILYWNSIGEISNNNIKNMSSPNYYEFTSYFRAPGYGPESRAQISILNNTFSKTGRTAIMAHDYVDMHIEDNSFDQIDSDYGFAVELGSAAAGTIRNNSFANYATWELGDMVPVSAIYINNTYTDTVTGAIDKVVVIDSNNIADCQYGIFVGNTYEGFAGNVDIDLTISNNNIQGNNATGSMSSGGILITDEGKDRGSSVFAKIDNNLIDDDSDYGVYIYSEGNGDITAWLRYNWVINNFIGISVKDFGSPSSSAYDLVIHNNYLSNNLNAENDAAFGYWDDSVSIGNCWSDYEYIPGEPYYVVPGNAEAIDRFPNTACGDCSPGDADNNGNLNILDITRLIGYLYKDGPAPAPYEICSGDPNINCVVNILDITYIIAALYKDGPAPGTVENWFQTCGGPIRAPIVELNLTGEINIFDPTKIDKTPPQR